MLAGGTFGLYDEQNGLCTNFARQRSVITRWEQTTWTNRERDKYSPQKENRPWNTNIWNNPKVVLSLFLLQCIILQRKTSSAQLRNQLWKTNLWNYPQCVIVFTPVHKVLNHSATNHRKVTDLSGYPDPLFCVFPEFRGAARGRPSPRGPLVPFGI